jgi:hypothetical protein
MMHLCLRTLLLLCIAAGGQQNLIAQESTVAAGGSASQASGAVSYSIGQLCYTSESHGTGSVQQGVQQTWAVIPSAIWEKPEDLSMVLFPNPAGNHVQILGASVPEKGCMLLYDAKGALQRSADFNEKNAACSLEGLPAGSYFLMLYGQHQLVFTATLIKSL